MPSSLGLSLVLIMWDEETVLHEIYYLTSEGFDNWRKLLALGERIEQHVKRKLLWIWPTDGDLLKCHKLLESFGINHILSIGCGSGLLEWLVIASASPQRKPLITLQGLEVDRNWWQSKYSVQNFIPVIYVEDNPLMMIDGHCDALLFCYFNNRPAFLDYLKLYHGTWLILIGPKPGHGIHTDPNPLQPQFPNHEWRLREQLNWTEANIVAIYERSSVVEVGIN
ncbi:uncharacterized protein [Drosophila tropicalis]|uniref:uncharacterized protein n=1 Tax=Drosophila tropicalis TaxID=46794 RepID=UPI0035AB797B